jgi:hypothetical protein
VFWLAGWWGESLKYERMFGLAGLRVELEKAIASEDRVDPFELHQLRTMMEYLWTDSCEKYDRSEEWRDQGFAKASIALHKMCGVKKGVANQTITLGRKLRQLPDTSLAWSQGQISRDHAQIIADAYTPEREAELRDRDLEPAFVAAAKHCDPNDFTKVVQHATDAIDGDGGASDADRKYARRRLHVSKTLDDMRALNGMLDIEGGMAVETALKLYEDPYRLDDPRTPAQKRADALVQICTVAIEQHGVLAGNVHPLFVVNIDLHDLEARGFTDLAADIRALKGEPLPRAILDRLMCQASVSRVITDGPSLVIDVGRASREFTVAQKRAILARDKVCKTCGAPGEHCQYHHIWRWEDGGPTNIDNGELQCGPCHRLIHKHDHRGPP